MRKIFAVTALIISSQTFAQDSTRTLEEVTLTASKFSTKTSETGKLVTIINRQDIERAGSRDLAQVITELGGVFINGFNSNAGKEKNIYFRGAKPEHTLITVNGIPVYDASGIGSNFDIRNISIDNVERIEILKGSQGTLYGTDAIAGVINIITKKPSASSTPAVSGNLSYGSYNQFRSGTTVSGSLKRIGYSLGLTHINTDGFSEAAKKNAADPDYEKDGYQQNSFNAQLHIPAGSLSIQPFIRYSYFRGDLDQDAFTDEKDFVNRVKNLQTGVQSILAAGKGNLHLNYQFTRTDRQYLDDSVYTDANAYYLFNKQQYKAGEHFAELFGVYPIGLVKLTAGVDYRGSNTSYDALQSNVFSPMLMKTGYGNDSTKQHQLGVYAALNYVAGGFSIEGGGRANNHSEYGSNFAFNINPSYLVMNRVKVFANVSTGYKTPSLYQLFSLYGNSELKPETSLNLEGGVQVYSSSKNSYIRLSYFNREVDDVIAFVSLFVPPYARYMNQDKQEDHGFEAELSATVANKLQLKALYSYVDGKINTKAAGKDTSYFNLLRRPKSTFNFSAGLQATPALYFSAQLNAVGKRKDIFFDPVTFQSVDITLKEYILLNFYAEYAVSKNLRVFGDFRNLLDKEYMDIYGYNTAGLNAYGGIRFKF